MPLLTSLQSLGVDRMDKALSVAAYVSSDTFPMVLGWLVKQA